MPHCRFAVSRHLKTEPPRHVEEEDSSIRHTKQRALSRLKTIKCRQAYPEAASNLLDIDDLTMLIKNTTTFLPDSAVLSTAMPAIINTTYSAPQECAAYVLIDLVRIVLEGNVQVFEDMEHDPDLYPALSAVIQHSLVRYLQTSVGRAPPSPKNWSIPRQPPTCTCTDCADVHRFLQDPARVALEIVAMKTRRGHLSKKFKDNPKESRWDIHEIGGGNPCTWRMTKHRRQYEQALEAWKTRALDASKTLKSLAENSEARLKSFLDPYYFIIMDIDMEAISKITSPEQLVSISGNVGSRRSTRTNNKRDSNSMKILDEA